MTKLRIGNRALIKDMNRSTVINTIRKKGPISRTDISITTGLGLSTISKIIDELMNNELVNEIGAATSTGGRRPILIEFNQKSGYAVGVKIMEDHLVVALTDLDPTIIESIEIPFYTNDESTSVIDLIITSIKKILTQQKIDLDHLEGIGIAVSGLIDSKRGIVVRSSLLGWEEVDLSSPIHEAFRTPVFLDNDVNAYTYAEIEKGYGTVHNNFICISIGDGIGASIVIDRKLYKGEFGGAGEFGHSIIQLGGRQCHCGQKGCLEMYASNKGLEEEAATLIPEYPDSQLQNHRINIEEVLKAALESDELAKVLFSRLGDYLGVGLINAINSFNPGTIVLIGEGMVAEEYFVPQAIQRAKENFFYHARYDTNVVTSTLGNDAWVKGAAILAIDQLFQPPIYEQQ
ncbi:ROK family protein [Alkalihalobacillus sp. AL-G]|uniref:ROK family protein n=1 Tax=Alkalihalobacillus sp. AL-G TaxID=2926399 RepID=UPI00272BF332|nr:ROK family protein [Alkalihalobacillus sp. AL-G]WLD92602.1 ROK family protein [Alkalihalobacillus sp. AL-G]